MSSCWWLNCSPAELRAASTCHVCGCHDADIDIGLCFVCFSRQYEMDRREQDAIAEQYNREHDEYCQRELRDSFDYINSEMC